MRNSHGSLKLPASGRFATESHHVLVDERGKGADGFPTSRTDGIEAHMAKHCAYVATLGLDCAKLYRKDAIENHSKDGKIAYERVWTGANSKKTYGHAWSSSDKPTIEQETWTFNMAWDFDFMKYRFGKKFRGCFKGKCVVMIARENGPSDAKWLGGVQPAIANYVGMKNTDAFEVGLLADQTLPLGPARCR